MAQDFERLVAFDSSGDVNIGTTARTVLTSNSDDAIIGIRLSNIVITDPTKKVRNVDRLTFNAVDYQLVSGSGKFTGSFKPFFFEVFGENDIKTITDLKAQNVLTHHTGTTAGNVITISGEYYSTTASDYTIRVDNETAQTLALSSISVTGGTLTATITGRNN